MDNLLAAGSKSKLIVNGHCHWQLADPERHRTYSSQIFVLDSFAVGGLMAKTVSCRDVGADCNFVARGNSEEEVLSQVSEHARTAHKISEIPPEVADKVRAAIHDEAA
jgi:predicted small metal-binding protein